MSTPFAILRHAITSWNVDRRLQGQTDIPLSAMGEEHAASWCLQPPADGWRRVTSPLSRARRTAELLQPAASVTIEPRLREMSFGSWEGHTIAELRKNVGEQFLIAEQRGLDFQPPNGESPREVMARMVDWAREIGRTGTSLVGVSHKAAIRALLAHALDWDMQSRQPVRLDWHCLHFFSATADGKVVLEQPNVPMAPDRRASVA
jgi:probable phosphoglycerate mutase